MSLKSQAMKTNNAFSYYARCLTTAWATKLLPLLLLLMVPGVVQAQSYTNNYGIWTYTSTTGTITITGYSGSGGVVTIPDTINALPVTTIGEHAFVYSGLTSVTIPNSVTSIGATAFVYSGLTNITIPDSVTNIGVAAFETCSMVITVDTNNPAYSSMNRVLFNKTQTTLVEYLADRGGSYTIPESVATIGDSAFSSCGLTNVTIPNSVTSIGATAFNLCGFTSITIPNSVTSIGDYAFEQCFSLTSVTIPGSVTKIGDSAFTWCGSLTNVTIGNGVVSIGDDVFDSCGRLTNVTIPDSVTSIGERVFGCSGLTNINVDANNHFYGSMDGVLFDKGHTTLLEYPEGKSGSYTVPNTVTSIVNSAFIDCPRLTSVTIPNSVTSIGDSAFGYCTGLTSVTIPNSVTSIGNSAFGYCTGLTSVTIPNSVTSIGDSAFNGCTSLTGVTIPSSVTSIGDDAFSVCTSLTSVTIGNSVTNIGSSAFSGCSGLTSITIPDSVTSIGDDAFGGCSSITAITVDTNNPAYSSLNGVLFNKSQTTLVRCPTGLAGSYTIPNTVTSIGDSAFYGCGLTNVTIPNGVTNIGDAVFSWCWSLTSVYLLGNAPTLGGDVFVSWAGHMPWLDPATVYYLPGTSGWGSTFGGLPTALWQPQVQASDASFGVRSNQFGFNINWASGMTVAVDACTNLANPTWTPIITNTLTSGSLYFSDPEWTKYPSRFYRLRSP